MVEEGFQKLFKESVVASLSRILGESAARSLLYHTGFERGETPGQFHERLVMMMGDGAFTLERSIVKELFARLSIQSPHVDLDFDFESSVKKAREMLAQKNESS